MTFKALAIDLDGTLLIGESLPEVHRDAVRRASDAGMEIIIATARWRQMAQRIAAEIGIEKPIIACSGAQLHVPDAGDVFDHRLPDDFVAALYDLCNRERCIATITLDDDVVLKLEGKPDPALIPAEMGWVPALDANDHGRPRIAAIQGTGVVQIIKHELAPQFADAINVFDSIGPNGKLVITITARAASKGEALKAGCDHLGIDPAEVIAFGDAENDIEMFKVAGASVAMGNALGPIKSAATLVTGANTEGGVATVINRLLDTGSLQ